MGQVVLRVPISGVPFGEVTAENAGTLAFVRHQETGK